MLKATETSPLPSSKQLHWQRIINEWKQSDETQQAYCDRLGNKNAHLPILACKRYVQPH